MSLLKAINLKAIPQPFEATKVDFLKVIESLDYPHASVTREDIAALAVIYTDYSLHYLIAIGSTLEPHEAQAKTMTFMNSYIAEAMHHAGLHYFNKEEGYSIVDKSIQVALDNDGVVTMDDVSKIIDEIELVYVETEEDFEE